MYKFTLRRIANPAQQGDSRSGRCTGFAILRKTKPNRTAQQGEFLVEQRIHHNISLINSQFSELMCNLK